MSDYIKRFTVRDSLVFYSEPSLQVKNVLDGAVLVSAPFVKCRVCLAFLARLGSLLVCKMLAVVREVFLE